jgi:hypothetical protein
MDWTENSPVQGEMEYGRQTWEMHANCSQLAALDRYLELQGVASHLSLSRRNM